MDIIKDVIFAGCNATKSTTILIRGIIRLQRDSIQPMMSRYQRDALPSNGAMKLFTFQHFAIQNYKEVKKRTEDGR